MRNRMYKYIYTMKEWPFHLSSDGEASKTCHFHKGQHLVASILTYLSPEDRTAFASVAKGFAAIARSLDVSLGYNSIPIPCVNEVDLVAAPVKFRYSDSVEFGPIMSNKLSRYRRAEGCACDGVCTIGVCPCIAFGTPALSPSFQPERHFFECHDGCKCARSCKSRIVQTSTKPSLHVFRTLHKGWGLKTVMPLPRAAFICTYTGEYLSTPEAKVRLCNLDLSLNNGVNYLLSIRETLSSRDVVLRCNVDASFVGNEARFINHSCEPNLVLQPVRCGSLVPRIALFTLCDIPSGGELTFDYGEGGLDNTVGTTEEGSEEDLGRKPCFCGATCCRGYLPYDYTL